MYFLICNIIFGVCVLLSFSFLVYLSSFSWFTMCVCHFVSFQHVFFHLFHFQHPFPSPIVMFNKKFIQIHTIVMGQVVDS